MLKFRFDRRIRPIVFLRPYSFHRHPGLDSLLERKHRTTMKAIQATLQINRLNEQKKVLLINNTYGLCRNLLDLDLIFSNMHSKLGDYLYK